MSRNAAIAPTKRVSAATVTSSVRFSAGASTNSSRLINSAPSALRSSSNRGKNSAVRNAASVLSWYTRTTTGDGLPVASGLTSALTARVIEAVTFASGGAAIVIGGSCGTGGGAAGAGGGAFAQLAAIAAPITVHATRSAR